MNKAYLALAALGWAIGGCSSQDDVTAGDKANAQANALDKQADIQEAVGDKAGAAAMRQDADATRQAGHAKEQATERSDAEAP